MRQLQLKTHTYVGLECLLIGCHAIRVLYINLAEDHRTNAQLQLKTHTYVGLECLLIGCHAIRVLYINLAEDHGTRANYSLKHTPVRTLIASSYGLCTSLD